jgi:hypothetical protein
MEVTVPNMAKTETVDHAAWSLVQVSHIGLFMSLLTSVVA